MWLAGWAAQHRRSILFLLVVAAIAGLGAGLNLPVALFPNVAFPRVRVTLDAGDRPAEAMVAEVTRRAEEAVRAVPGVRDVRSTTSRGSAEMSLTFDWGLDMDKVELQVESALARILPDLPQGTSFTAKKLNPTVFPVAAYTLTSDSVDQMTLRDVAQYQLVPLLSAVPGVASVDVQGGEVREYRVSADPALLASYGVSTDDVITALQQTNVFKVVGRVEDRHKLLLALTDSRLRTIDQIGRTILRSNPNGTVRLADVARIEEAPQPNYTIVTADGRRAVIVQVYQQPDGNTVDIVKGVASTLATYHAKLRRGLRIHQWYDQSELILASAGSVRDAILIGIVLSALVLFAFLRSWKLTGVVLVFVPSVLAITVLVLFALRMSFNIMTLGGMAAAIGLVIDDAIVMLEQIVRRLKHGTDPRDSIREAATEYLAPLAGSSAATIIIFVPLAFLSGVTGAFFKALSLTMASALVISFIVAWFIIPLLATRLVSLRDAEREEVPRPIYDRVIARYRDGFSRAHRQPLWAAGALVVLLAAGIFAYFQMGTGFMPKMDEGGFIIDYIAPPGTSLADTNRMLLQVESIIRATPEVDTYSRRTGLQLGGGLTEANTGDYFVRLKRGPRRPIDEVMEEIHHKIEENIPGLDIETAQLMEDLIGDLTAVPQPIEIELFGDDQAALEKLGGKVADLISHIEGVTEIKNGVVIAGDAVSIDVNTETAELEGLTPSEIATQLETSLAGTAATEIQHGERVNAVRVWVPGPARRSVADMGGIQLSAPDGHRVALSRVANIRLLTGQPELTRDNLKMMVDVTARIEGRDLGSTIADVRTALDRSGLITGSTYYDLGGLYKQQQIAFRGLLAVIVAAFFLVFALLLFLYERFSLGLAVVAMPLLAMPAVFLGLWITGTELNITAMMGMTMVVGIVTEVAIFYVSEYRLLLAEGTAPDTALAQAGVNRFRPIAMTTLATILTLLPLALGIGQGAAMQQPLAIAIISGLIVQMPLVLIVLPLVTERLERLRVRWAD